MMRGIARRIYNALPRSAADRVARLRVRTIAGGAARGLKFSAVGVSSDYADGTNELPVQDALARHVRPGDVFYDIGANVGFFTLVAAKLVGPSGRVFAFEPVPRNAASVRRDAALNRLGHVTVIEKAVAAAAGSAELTVTSHPGGAALASVGPTPPDAVGTITVETVSIDDLVARGELPPPDVAKVDVEGAEADVFTGMAQTLDRHAPIVIYEVDDRDEQRFKSKWQHLQNLIEQHGYEVHPIEAAYGSIGWHVGHALALPRRRGTSRA